MASLAPTVVAQTRAAPAAARHHTAGSTPSALIKGAHAINVYLEVGKSRTLAGAVEWPGWNRSGRNADAALEALVRSAPRYAAVLEAAHIQFAAPGDVAALRVVEELAGNTTTDFGAPDVAPAADSAPIDAAALEQLGRLLRAYWDAFAVAIREAQDKPLRLGPRGGGRELDAIVEHTVNAEASYLLRLAYKWKPAADATAAERLTQTHAAALDALAAAARGNLPAQGPRGGKIWKPRFFVRRAGWHVLDHVWEIEDRVG